MVSLYLCPCYDCIAAFIVLNFLVMVDIQGYLSMNSHYRNMRMQYQLFRMTVPEYFFQQIMFPGDNNKQIEMMFIGKRNYFFFRV